LSCAFTLPDLPPFPTRRSSDLNGIADVDDFHFFGVHLTTNKAYYWFSLAAVVLVFAALHFLNHSRTGRAWRAAKTSTTAAREDQDRKSTRLNSSHSQISYAVFC